MIILSIYKNTYKNLQEYCKNIARISQCLLFSPSAFRILLESDEDRLLVVFNRGLILMTEVFLLLILINSLLFLPIQYIIPISAFTLNCFSVVSFKIQMNYVDELLMCKS